jgi:aspartate aminotransferase
MHHPGSNPSPGAARSAAVPRPVLDLASAGPGVPVHPELVARLGAAAHLGDRGPALGGHAVRTAASGYFARRGLGATPERTVYAPGTEPLLLALLAAAQGDVLLPLPSARWPEPEAGLLHRRVIPVPTPAECGGVPDPFALLETARRARREGAQPRVLVVTVPDDPTGTIPPPDLFREVCEAAQELGLVVVADESRRDLTHHTATVAVSAADTLPGQAVVLCDLGPALGLDGWRSAVALLPEGPVGERLLDGLATAAPEIWGAPAAPVEAATAYALTEPEPLRAHLAAAVRLHTTLTTATRSILVDAGALCPPPEAGYALYADLTPAAGRLTAHGVTGAPALERHLLERFGIAVRGGHRFGDDPAAPRLRLTTGGLHGPGDELRRHTLRAPDPLALPHVAGALERLRHALTEPAAPQ